ncbi:SDR family NAD(P)-dependent oxidoreductase [Peribacillus sp. SCS-155]|uniref:SDR family NAD(P)-dependent oxidoreductase n=1 Tax=Peribacillus sedimenti TaxID=3115297 RepID=UPI0039066FBC
MNWKKKHVIVTGSGSGIGKGVALHYGSLGAHVIIAEMDEEKGKAVEGQITSSGGKGFFIKTDVRDEASIRNMLETAVQKFGPIHVLINNAGVSKFKNLHELSVAEWDDILSTNLRSVFIASKEASKNMERGAAIVNIASTRAFMSEKDSEAYAASKGGIFALTHALAASLSEQGIRVNSISPGWIQNENYDQLSEKDHLQHWSGRVGKPSDIARACLYLTDPENDFVNGENIVVDGGMTRKMIYEE